MYKNWCHKRKKNDEFLRESSEEQKILSSGRFGDSFAEEVITSEGSENGTCRDEERDPRPPAKWMDAPEQRMQPFMRNEQNLPNANMGGK